MDEDAPPTASLSEFEAAEFMSNGAESQFGGSVVFSILLRFIVDAQAVRSSQRPVTS